MKNKIFLWLTKYIWLVIYIYIYIYIYIFVCVFVRVCTYDTNSKSSKPHFKRKVKLNICRNNIYVSITKQEKIIQTILVLKAEIVCCLNKYI